tara:strand:- start:7612 stop:7905 length:294 start_codon:yes stop_codon:yes gene_type:complete
MIEIPEPSPDPVDIADRMILALSEDRLGRSSGLYSQFYKGADRAAMGGVNMWNYVAALVENGQIPEEKQSGAYQHLQKRIKKRRDAALIIDPLEYEI